MKLAWVFPALFLLVACGGADQPFHPSSDIPIPAPVAGGDDTSEPPVVPDDGNGGGSQQQGCLVKLEGKLDLKVSAHMQGKEPVHKIDAIPVDMTPLSLLFKGTEVSLAGTDFPKILLDQLSDEHDLVVGGNTPGNKAIGTYDPQTGKIELKGFHFVVQILNGKGLASGNLGTPIVLPKVDLITGSVTATGNHQSITVTGKPLANQTKELTLVAGLTFPAGTLLDAGGIGGGALTAAFIGHLDKLPSDPSCEGGGLEGPPGISIKQLVGDEEQDIGGNVYDFGEKFAGGLEEKTVKLRIKNTGVGNLQIKALHFSENSPMVLLNAAGASLLGDLLIPGGTYLDLQVSFKPSIDQISSESENVQHTLNIASNAPQNASVLLTFKGTILKAAARLSLRVLEKNEANNAYEFIETNSIDFGTVFFPTNKVVPDKRYRYVRIYNTGVLDLPLKKISQSVADFSFGTLRYGYNTAKNCEAGKSAIVQADQCSVLINDNILSQSASVVNLPPANPNDLNNSVHFDMVLGYQPTTHQELSTGKLTIAANALAPREITTTGHVDANTRAKIILYFDDTPDNTEDVSKEIAVKNGEIYNVQRVKTAEKLLNVYIANNGAEGGDLLKIDPAKIILEDGEMFSLDLADIDPQLVSGIKVSDGKKLLGKLKVKVPAQVIPFHHVPFKIAAKSVKENGQNESELDPFASEIYYGLPEGDQLTLFVYFASGAIDNKDLIKKPAVTDAGDPLGSIPIKIKLSGTPGGIIVGKVSTSPNFEESPSCTGSDAERKACAKTLAPTRLITTSLGAPSNTCKEGDYDGLYETGECSYFTISFAGKNGTDYKSKKIEDTLLEDSEIILDPATMKAKINFHNVLIRFSNTEHSLMNGKDSFFDHILPISFTTGEVNSDFSGYDMSAYPLLAATHINQAPMDAHICDGDANDGDKNPGDCDAPGDLPNDRGVLVGSDWDLQTGKVSLVGTTRIDQKSAQNPKDAFFGILGERYFYMLLESKICGDAIDVPCK